MPERDARKLDFIDALRGLAIMEVVLNHAALWVRHLDKSTLLIARNGTRGVELFFVVSALSLFLSYDSRRQMESHPVRNFYLRRFLRLAPMYYLALVVWVVLKWGTTSFWAPIGMQWWHVLLNVTFLFGWLPETFNEIVPGSWSIAITFTFSLLLPVLYARIRGIRASLVFIVFTILLGAVLTPLMRAAFLALHPADAPALIKGFGKLWFFAHLPAYAIGILVYHVIRRKGVQPDRSLGYTLFTIAVILSVADLSATMFQPVVSREFLYAIAFGCLAVALFHAKVPLVVNPVICWIGRISYSIYFVHEIVLLILQRVMYPAGFPMVGKRGLLVAWIIVMLLSSASAWVTHRWIERPFIQLGSRWIRRLETPPVVAEATIPAKEAGTP